MTIDQDKYLLLKKFTGYWSKRAILCIFDVHKNIPDTATLKERSKYIDDAYPFGPRTHHPYKSWLRVRSSYLKKYGYIGKGKPKVCKEQDEIPGMIIESPLERAKRRSQP